MGDLEQDEVLVGRGKGKTVLGDITVSLIEWANTWNEMGVHEGVEQAQLNNRLQVGDKELEGGSRGPLTELDPTNM